MPHSADLVSLLEAAPGLRRVGLRSVGQLSFRTVQWLARRRPGFQLEGEAGDITLLLPAAAGE
jgi:hypothetical protein